MYMHIRKFCDHYQEGPVALDRSSEFLAHEKKMFKNKLF